MEEIQNDNTSKTVVGASYAGTDGDATVNPFDQSELPMIVWLKGDEPMADEFSLDADAAMAALGIKRSRLTQISGRELRVGRIRIDRYTRPVYRPEDIAIYKQWTRPTATHLRSSSVISDAAKRLEEHTQQMTSELKEGLDQQVAELTSALAQVRSESETHMQAYLQQTAAIGDAVKQQVQEHYQHAADDLRVRANELTHKVDGLENKWEAVDNLGQELAHTRQDLRKQGEQLDTLVQAVSQLTEYLGGFIEQQTNTNRDLGKALSLVIQFVRDGSRKQDETLALLQNQGTDQNQNLDRSPLVQRPLRARPNPNHFSWRRLR